MKKKSQENQNSVTGILKQAYKDVAKPLPSPDRSNIMARVHADIDASPNPWVNSLANIIVNWHDIDISMELLGDPALPDLLEGTSFFKGRGPHSAFEDTIYKRAQALKASDWFNRFFTSLSFSFGPEIPVKILGLYPVGIDEGDASENMQDPQDFHLQSSLFLGKVLTDVLVDEKTDFFDIMQAFSLALKYQDKNAALFGAPRAAEMSYIALDWMVFMSRHPEPSEQFINDLPEQLKPVGGLSAFQDLMRFLQILQIADHEASLTSPVSRFFKKSMESTRRYLHEIALGLQGAKFVKTHISQIQVPVYKIMRPDVPGAVARAKACSGSAQHSQFKIKLLGAGGGHTRQYSSDISISTSIDETNPTPTKTLFQEITITSREYKLAGLQDPHYVSQGEKNGSLVWKNTPLPGHYPASEEYILNLFRIGSDKTREFDLSDEQQPQTATITISSAAGYSRIVEVNTQLPGSSSSMSAQITHTSTVESKYDLPPKQTYRAYTFNTEEGIYYWI